ncbi:MAG: phage tail spike protein, partial [Acutalibacteraceae bacterium]|nr:phage tail spike protein [Acutalibacteraceae bacterium]
MIPILYDKSVTNFETNGLGGLPDCLNCEVNEERNGIYELSLTYPITGVNFENLQYDNLIKVKPNRVDGEQIFRIYFVSKPLSGKVVVQAEHISYMLRNIPVRPFSADTAADAVAAIPSYSAVDNPFTFYTDIVSTTGYKIDVPRNCRELLGGSEGSLLDV